MLDNQGTNLLLHRMILCLGPIILQWCPYVVSHCGHAAGKYNLPQVPKSFKNAGFCLLEKLIRMMYQVIRDIRIIRAIRAIISTIYIILFIALSAIY